MIIDKVAPYWTAEDRLKLLDIQHEQEAMIVRLQLKRKDSGISDEAELKSWNDLEDKANKIREEVEARYIKGHSKKEILADAKEIVSSIEKKDFLARIEEQTNQIATLQENGASDYSLDILRKYVVENFENCCNYILYFLRVQINALADDEEYRDKLQAIVEKRVSLWYVKPQPEYLPMAHGKATDAFSFMNTKNVNIDRITGTATIDKFGVQLAILKLQELHATLGISTDKLLSTAIAIFTKQNDFRHTNTQPHRRDVAISLKEYAQLLGYDVEEHETSTPEEAEREKKRAKGQLDNARKAIKKDLLLLQASTLRWEEEIKGKTRDFDSVSIVTRVSIRNGEIKIFFSPEIAGYLAERNLITQYPTKLLGISGRQPNAYYIGKKLSEYYNMDNNQRRGTQDRISIPALLAVTELPSYEDVMKQDRHWERRIKEPLEQALDTLTEVGYLKDWKYTHARGIELTEEEAYNITSYDDFSKLYLRFTPVDKVDHSDRIEAKQKAREEARKKPRRKRQSTSKEE